MILAGHSVSVIGGLDDMPAGRLSSIENAN